MPADETARWTTLVQEGLHARGGDVATAAVRFTDAAAIDPRHADGQYALGQSLLQLGRFEGAAGLFETAELEQRLAERVLAIGVARVDGGRVREPNGGGRDVAAERARPSCTSVVQRAVSSAGSCPAGSRS